jgi:hypothetical protein
MIDRLRKLESELSQERGPFDLFGLFLREGAPNRWDVVIAASWFGDDEWSVLRFLVDKIKKAVGINGLMMISRVVPLPSRSPFLSAARRAVRIEHGLEEIRDREFGNIEISRGYVITCRSRSRVRA